MNELEWLTSNDPAELLRSLQDRAGERKLNLFAAACIRTYGYLLEEEESRRAYFVLERFADGLAKPEELAIARQLAVAGRLATTRRHYDNPSSTRALHDVTEALVWATQPAHTPLDRAVLTARCAAGGAPPQGDKKMQHVQADLVRDLFGSPSRPFKLDKRWLATRGRYVRQIARTIYDERTFSEELPILRDALLEADCPHPELLDHCMDAVEHGRGCWAVDCILGLS
jgi:hypothetical protein